MTPIPLLAWAAAAWTLAYAATASAETCVVAEFAGAGQPRLVLIGHEDRPMIYEQDRQQVMELSLYANFEAAPDDAAARAFWETQFRTTHYWSFQRLARSYADCFAESAEFEELRADFSGGTVRAAYRERRHGFVVAIDASRRACGRSPGGKRYLGECLTIQVTPSRSARR